MISYDKCYFGSRFFSIKGEIMAFSKFFHEFEKDKILDSSLLHLSLVVYISEDGPEIIELTEVDLHMTCCLSITMISPWSESHDDTMCHEYFCVFIDFTTGDAEYFCETITFEEISCIHRESPHILFELFILFFEQFLFHN